MTFHLVFVLSPFLPSMEGDRLLYMQILFIPMNNVARLNQTFKARTFQGILWVLCDKDLLLKQAVVSLV